MSTDDPAPMLLKSLDLFSGIGGITHALRGIAEPVAYCDIEPNSRAVLEANMRRGNLPRAPIAHDRDGETAHGHELLEDQAEIRLVFRNEHADRRRGIAGAERSRAHGAMPIGSETRKTAPAP